MDREQLLGIAARRLVNHRLEGPPLAGVADVVRHLGAVQAQEYPVARWTVGLRAAGVDEAAVDAALASGDVVRTHVLRDTWHLVAREDLRWLLQVTAPRILRRNAPMHRREGLDDALLARTDALLGDAVRGRQLTRAELVEALALGGVEAKGFKLAYIVMHAELTGVLCSGALRGKQHTYALLDERAPVADPLDPDEGLARLARRFLAAHGPAQAEDLARWASLPVGEARRAVTLAAASGLVREPFGDRIFWSLPESSDAVSAPPRAHLLQAFDEYAIGYLASRDAIDVDGLLAGPPPPGQATNLIILGGQLVGRWRRKATSRTLTIETHLARPLDAAETAALEDAKRRYAAFTGLTLA